MIAFFSFSFSRLFHGLLHAPCHIEMCCERGLGGRREGGRMREVKEIESEK